MPNIFVNPGLNEGVATLPLSLKTIPSKCGQVYEDVQKRDFENNWEFRICGEIPLPHMFLLLSI